jgi:hypothetical protein
MDFGSPNQNPLLSKQAIIVLREELEYFVIPPEDGGKSGAGTDQHGIANQVLLDMKRESGVQLLEKKQIFTALQVGHPFSLVSVTPSAISHRCQITIFKSRTDPKVSSVTSTRRTT